MSPSKKEVKDALDLLLYLGLVEYDGETARWKATDKAMTLDDEQIEEMLDKAVGRGWRQRKLFDLVERSMSKEKKRPKKGWLSDPEDTWFWHTVVMIHVKLETPFHVLCDRSIRECVIHERDPGKLH